MVLVQIVAGQINYFPLGFHKPGPLIAAIKQRKFFAVARVDFIHLLLQTESFIVQFPAYVPDGTNPLTWETFRMALGLNAAQFEHVNSSLREYSIKEAPKKVLTVIDSVGGVAKAYTYRALSPANVYEFPELMSLLMLWLDPSNSNASCASPTAHLLPSLIRGEDGNFGKTAVVLTQCPCDQLHEQVRTRCCNMSRMFTICFIGHVCTSA